MIHHVSIGTNDLKRARAFYDKVLEVVGLRLLKADEESLDYGASTIIFSVETPVDGKPATPGNGVHIAFVAPGPATVDDFYRIALENGGSDDGHPGLRPKVQSQLLRGFRARSRRQQN